MIDFDLWIIEYDLYYYLYLIEFTIKNRQDVISD